MSVAGATTDRWAIVRLALLLSVLQIIGWGATYNSPAVLWRPVAADLGVAKEFVFAGTTVMLVLSAMASPSIGRMFDRRGPREATAAGFAIIGLGRDGWSYLAGWVVIGLGTPLALMQTAVTVMAQHGGERARFGMSLVTVFTALSPTISWPACAFLEAQIGWRGTMLVYAALSAGIAAPAALFVVPKGGPKPDEGEAPTPERADRRLADRHREQGVRLFALATALQGFASWGLFLHVIGLMEALGHGPAMALFLASLLGPASVIARATDMITSRWFSALDSALIALGVIVGALVLMGFVGRDATLAGACIVVYSLGAGAMALARSTVPLEIFGRDGYATVMGRIGLPQHLAYAVAPVMFATFLSVGGPYLAIAAAGLLSVAALVTLARLGRLVVSSRKPDTA
jgi:predicted MFS family arabinose efflux permease